MPPSNESIESTVTGSRSSSSELHQQFSGYDIIGDVHGCGAALELLLHDLDYLLDDSSGAYAHPERQAIFVGDLVDRGHEQVGVLQIVKKMVDAGSAQMVMGNHRFNAIAYATEHRTGQDSTYGHAARRTPTSIRRSSTRCRRT